MPSMMAPFSPFNFVLGTGLQPVYRFPISSPARRHSTNDISKEPLLGNSVLNGHGQNPSSEAIPMRCADLFERVPELKLQQRR